MRKYKHAAKRLPFINIIAFAILLWLCSIFNSCNPVNVVSANGDSVSLKKLHDNLKASLDGNCTGYAFTISYQGVIKLDYIQAGGKKRTAADPPQANFSLYDPIAIASVSKEITATAVIKALDEQHIDQNAKISNYLPADWIQGPLISKITFRNLLTHTSGFRMLQGQNVNVAVLKSLVAAGVTTITYDSMKYENIDFALFRYIIPEMIGKHNLTDEGYSAAYLQYCQEKIFNPAKIADVQLKSTGDTTQALSYTSTAGSIAGTDWGDLTLYCGSQGFNLSVWQLSLFQNKLWYSTQILSAPEIKLMKDSSYGLWNRGVVNGIHYWGHNGFYPYDGKNQGLLWAHLMHFENGVDIAIIVNSPIAVNGVKPVTDINGVTGAYVENVLTSAFNASFK